jgi:hypothetical protein
MNTETPLLDTTAQGLEDSYRTAVWKEKKGSLLLAQETNRDDPEADDVIVLDLNTQHALYALLKKRFEAI